MASSAVRSIVGYVFGAALLLYVGTSGGNLSSTDAVVTFEVTRSLVDHGSVALPGNLLGLDANRGVDGRYYSQYGIGQSIYNIPFYLAGRAVQQATGVHIGKADSLTKAAVAMGSAVAAAGCVATVFVLAWLITGRVRASLIASAACAVGSLLWPYARLGFNAPLAAWILTAAATCLYAGVTRDRPGLIAFAGILVGAGCLTRHEFVLVAMPFAAWLAITPGVGASGGSGARGGSAGPVLRRRLTLFLPGIIAGLTLWAIYNVVRFGNPWFVGYAPWYSIAGYFGLLLSPAGSVFVYSPTIVLGLIGLAMLARGQWRTAWLLAGPGVVLFLFYGALDDWAGGRSYGPRYLVPVLPLLAIPIATLFDRAASRGRRIIVAAIAIGAILQLPGVLVDYSHVSQSWARTASADDLLNRRYRWSASPLLLDSEAAIAAVPRTATYLTGREPPPRIDVTASADRHDFAQQFSFSLDFWWLYLFYLRVLPATAAWIVGLGLLIAPIALSARAWARAGRLDQNTGAPIASSSCQSAS